MWPSSTYILVPSSLQAPAPFEPEPEPEPDAAMAMPDSSQRPLSSVKASAPRRRPEAMSGRWALRASSSSQDSRALAASTTDEKYGAHSRARPISSNTMTCSTKLKPCPP